MKYSIVLMCLVSMVFGEILSIDSIIDPHNWLNPESILVSDDFYAQAHQHNDAITVSLSDPTQPVFDIDSVFIFVEQYVTDSANALWRIVPIIQDSTYPPSPLQFGTEYESHVRFDISSVVLSEADLISLQVELVAERIVGPQPDWFADHLYVEAFYQSTGIQEHADHSHFDILVPTIMQKELSFICTLREAAPISITVWNSLGQPIARDIVHGIEGRNQINMNNMGNLTNGVYFLQTEVQGRINTAKFLFVE